MKQITYIVLALMSISLITACSSGGDADSAGGGRGGSQNGFLSLAVTDAPIDGAAEVWVQFDGVELKPQSGSAITIFFDKPMKINLLALQGVNSAQLLVNETFPAGAYNWIRLLVTAADDGVMDSYIVLNNGGGVFDLDIPSGDETGLKIIGGLKVIPNTPTNMTIDFNLRKSITVAGGAYKLSPVLKLIKDKDAGSIVGTVELSALTGPDCSDADLATNNAIYLYDGFDVTPDDVGSNSEPVTSAIVSLNDATGTYDYSFGFIPFGQYTTAFTCQADLDDPKSNDAIIFSSTMNVDLTSTDTFSAMPFQ